MQEEYEQGEQKANSAMLNLFFFFLDKTFPFALPKSQKTENLF